MQTHKCYLCHRGQHGLHIPNELLVGHHCRLYWACLWLDGVLQRSINNIQNKIKDVNVNETYKVFDFLKFKNQPTKRFVNLLTSPCFSVSRGSRKESGTNGKNNEGFWRETVKRFLLGKSFWELQLRLVTAHTVTILNCQTMCVMPVFQRKRSMEFHESHSKHESENYFYYDW